MNCPNCQIEHVSGAKYCNACDTELETSCQQCGKINPPGSNFCNKCGHSLSKAVSTSPSTAAFEHGESNILPMDSFAPDDGERRQATILFSDLSGYTSMNEKLDPEEFRVITSHIKSEAVRIVEGYEGTVTICGR
jgi:adenylate cyclase